MTSHARRTTSKQQLTDNCKLATYRWECRRWRMWIYLLRKIANLILESNLGMRKRVVNPYVTAKQTLFEIQLHVRIYVRTTLFVFSLVNIEYLRNITEAHSCGRHSVFTKCPAQGCCTSFLVEPRFIRALEATLSSSWIGLAWNTIHKSRKIHK